MKVGQIKIKRSSLKRLRLAARELAKTMLEVCRSLQKFGGLNYPILLLCFVKVWFKINESDSLQALLVKIFVVR